MSSPAGVRPLNVRVLRGHGVLVQIKGVLIAGKRGGGLTAPQDTLPLLRLALTNLTRIDHIQTGSSVSSQVTTATGCIQTRTPSIANSVHDLN